MSSNSLVFPSALCSTVNPIQYIFPQNCLFHLCSSVWAFFMPRMCLFNMLMLLSPFLIICSTVVSWFSVSSVSFLCFCCLIRLLIRFIFQLLCMPGNYLSDARHHKSAFARCWVFLELFSDAVRLLVSSLVLLRLTFKLVGTSSPWCDARVNLPLRYEPECPNTQYSRYREVCHPGREERELLSSLCGL